MIVKELKSRFSQKEIQAIHHAEGNGYEKHGLCFAWIEPGPRKRILFVHELPLMRSLKVKKYNGDT
jgi:hypothetical protein